MTGPDAVDVASPEHHADPFPFYAELRRRAPVCRIPLRGGGLRGDRSAWLITRYDDVAATLKDERFVKDRASVSTDGDDSGEPWTPSFVRPLTRNMLDRDPPDHTRLRALVQLAFTPRRIERMRARIEELTAELLEDPLRRGKMDLIDEYALPLPMTVIAEMLGIPPDDRHRFRRWSTAIVAADSSRWTTLRAIPSLWSFLRYLRRLVKSRRSDPRDDLVSALVAAEESGDRLTGDEVLAMVFLLLVAGHETTVNLIGNGVLALLHHPNQLERLRDDPGLTESAVEELLRFSGPLETATERYAREEVTIRGTTIPEGELVYAAVSSANRDERQFQDPDTLDLGRDPNPHLAFGLGIHYCLGAALARLEARTALRTLLDRAPGLGLAAVPGSLRWKRGIVLRGLEKLPVSLR